MINCQCLPECCQKQRTKTLSEKLIQRLQSWQETLWLLMALLTPLFVNLWVEQQFEASKIWLLRTLIWLLVVIWLYGWLAGLRPRQLPSPIGTLLIALFLILVLATLLSPYRHIATFGTLDRAGGLITQLSYLALFFCVATQINPDQSRHLLHVIIIPAIPICLFGLAQAAGWQPLPVFTDARTAITTTLGRANFTGAYLALLLPLTLAAAQTAVERWRQTGYWTLFVLMLLVIGVTQARAALIAAAAGFSVYFWLLALSKWSRAWRWTSALTGLALAGGGLLFVLDRGLLGGGSIAARWTIWQASLRLLWPRLWLGYGADTLELVFPAVYPPQLVYYQGRGIVVDRAHNWLLDWSLSYGVVATVLLSVLVGLILHAGWKQFIAPPFSRSPVSTREQLDRRWLAAATAGIVAHLAGNLFLFDVAATALIFWLLLAILTAAAVQNRPSLPQPSWPNRARTIIFLTSIIIWGGAVWQANLRPLIADAYSWQGTRALNQGDVPGALERYSAAAALQPQRAPYHTAAALTAAQLGRFDQAEASMQAAIALRPADPVLYGQLAAVFAGQEKVAQAYRAYDRAIALAPTIALTHQRYADLALRSGDMETAWVNAARAVDLDATDGVAYGILGWVELQNGRLAAAEAAFEKAVRWQPDSADFYLGLATVYYQQGEIEAARQAVETSLRLDPDYSPALTLQLQLNDG